MPITLHLHHYHHHHQHQQHQQHQQQHHHHQQQQRQQQRGDGRTDRGKRPSSASRPIGSSTICTSPYRPPSACSRRAGWGSACLLWEMAAGSSPAAQCGHPALKGTRLQRRPQPRRPLAAVRAEEAHRVRRARSLHLTTTPEAIRAIVEDDSPCLPHGLTAAHSPSAGVVCDRTSVRDRCLRPQCQLPE